MYKLLTYSCLFLALLSCKHEPIIEHCNGGQCGSVYVTHEPQPRHVVIELFDGLMNQYSHDAREDVRNIQLDNPTLVHVIRVDCGGFSIPRGGYPDFRTPFGDSLLLRSKALAFPCANINRGEYWCIFIIATQT